MRKILLFFFLCKQPVLKQCTTKLIMIGLEDLVEPEGVIAQRGSLYMLYLLTL